MQKLFNFSDFSIFCTQFFKTSRQNLTQQEKDLLNSPQWYHQLIDILPQIQFRVIELFQLGYLVDIKKGQLICSGDLTDNIIAQVQQLKHITYWSMQSTFEKPVIIGQDQFLDLCDAQHNVFFALKNIYIENLNLASLYDECSGIQFNPFLHMINNHIEIVIDKYELRYKSLYADLIDSVFQNATKITIYLQDADYKNIPTFQIFIGALQRCKSIQHISIQSAIFQLSRQHACGGPSDIDNLLQQHQRIMQSSVIDMHVLKIIQVYQFSPHDFLQILNQCKKIYGKDVLSLAKSNINMQTIFDFFSSMNRQTYEVNGYETCLSLFVRPSSFAQKYAKQIKK